LYATLTPALRAMTSRSASIASRSPNPFSITLQPSAAKAWATARPIPLVDPVTSAALPSSDIEVHFLKKDAAAEA
jgi:hypothetical protein